MPTVGFIGLGAMGQGMARNLARAGLLAAVWNRTSSRSAEFIQEFPEVRAESLEGLARSCEVIFLSVSADKDVIDLVTQIKPTLRPGKIIVDTSTVAAATARALAADLQSLGVVFLDAPVSGGVEGARQASLVMMVGGDSEAYIRVKPLLEKISRQQIHLGPVGHGQLTKAVNQVMAAGINQAVCEALAFAEALELDLDKVIDVIGQGAAGNWFLQKRGATMVRSNYAPGFKLALHHKDLLICRAAAQTLTAKETRLPLIEMTLIHYQRLMDAGFGDEDISALFRLKRQLFSPSSR